MSVNLLVEKKIEKNGIKPFNEVSITKKYIRFYHNETLHTTFVNPADLSVVKVNGGLEIHTSSSDDLIVIKNRDRKSFFVNDLASGKEKEIDLAATSDSGCQIDRSHMTDENINADFSQILIAITCPD